MNAYTSELSLTLSLLHPCPYNPAHIEWQIHTSPHMYIVPYNNKCPITIYSCAHSIGPDPLGPETFRWRICFQGHRNFPSQNRLAKPHKHRTHTNPIQPHPLLLFVSMALRLRLHIWAKEYDFFCKLHLHYEQHLQISKWFIFDLTYFTIA